MTAGAVLGLKNMAINFCSFLNCFPPKENFNLAGLSEN
jgi:hypothetical protein